VTTVVCTPHLSRRFPTDLRLARERLRDLEGALVDAGVPLQLELAAEIAPANAVAMATAELRERAIGGTYVLVELEPGTAASFGELIVAQLAPEGLVPVLAHPERCRALQRDLAPLTAAREAGAVVQVVANSLAGSWGTTVAHTAWNLITSERADVVASDAHGQGRRGALTRVLPRLYERVGGEVGDRLVIATPRALVEGRAV
jgi:protein-tyrosine phosphatase